MKIKTKSLIAVVSAVLVGYLIGCIVGFPSSNSGLASGDIAKVSKYHQNSVSPALSAYQEKIQHDSTLMKSTAISLAVLTSRMDQFSKLVELSTTVSEGIDELSDEVATLNQIKTISDNASNNGRLALSSFAKLATSRNAAGNDYEQTSQNFTIAYLMVERQIKVAKDYVVAVDAFLKDKNVEDYPTLAAAHDMWSQYCAGDAKLNGDDDELEYWSKQSALATTDNLGVVSETLSLGQETLSLGQESLSLGQEFLGFGIETLGFGQESLSFGQETLSLGIEVLSLGIESLSLGQETLSLDQEVLGIQQSVKE